MPTYEYQCLKCKKKFERLQRITEPSLKKCVFCEGKVDRLISAGTGFIFKGSGFYATDYKRQKTEDGGQKTEDSKQKTGDSGQKTEKGKENKKTETKSANDK